MPNDRSKCCEPKKKFFQGKAYIPDDHIQLISKYFQGANLNLNFAVDDEESSDKDCCKKKRRKRSRSRKRSSKKRRRRSKRCKCCKCHEEKCEVPQSCCCGTSVKYPPKPMKRSFCDKIDPCAPAVSKCCCGGKTGDTIRPDCSEVKPDPCAAKCCCEGRTQPAVVKSSICCCEKPVEPEPEKICCCCGRPCVEKNNDEAKSSMKSKQDQTENSKTKGKSTSKVVEDADHQHTRCCCKCRDREDKEEANGDENRLEVPKNEKEKSHKKGPKRPSPQKFSESSDSIKSNSSNAGGKNVKQVYITKKVSSLENDEVYGRYWYHRPPLENTITHCDDDDYPGPSGYRNDYPGASYRNERPCEDGGPCDGRAYPPNAAYAYSALQYSETGDHFRRGSGRCLACKEPMCLSCKMSICECDCDRPNFVICNSCKHRLAPKPPKKPCPPKKPKPKQTQPANGGCDEAMFLLPLLASMQGNNNFQQCPEEANTFCESSVKEVEFAFGPNPNQSDVLYGKQE